MQNIFCLIILFFKLNNTMQHMMLNFIYVYNIHNFFSITFPYGIKMFSMKLLNIMSVPDTSEAIVLV